MNEIEVQSAAEVLPMQVAGDEKFPEETRLTYRFQGRDYRLTDVHGELVPGLVG